ncbi:MAG TPA: hypothetical protein ENG30_02705, partial [Thermofilaceae archaeon]|nr:hypothetical protein [Thermofilaceae archaeon]
MTHKLKWQVERNKPPIPFPHHVFWWQSPDGSRVLAYHTVGSYSEDVDERRIAEQLEVMKSRHGLNLLMYLYGRGDHGGGPTEEMVIRAGRIAEKGVFDLKFAKAIEFFEEVEKIASSQSVKVPVVNDELYVKTHRGTYTTEAAVKVSNRRCENLLLNAERFSILASSLLGAPYPSEELRRLWELLLLNQVHDNLDGTSIEQAYQDGMLDYLKIRLDGGRLLKEAIRAIASRIDTSKLGRTLLVFNPLPWTRSGVVEVEGLKDVSIIDLDGTPLPVQYDSETGNLIFIAHQVPGLGYKAYILKKETLTKAETDLKVEGLILENSFLRVVVDESTGNLVSIYDKVNGFELLDPERGGNFLKLFVDRPPGGFVGALIGEPAWNIYLGPADDPQTTSVKLIEEGPVRARVKVEKRFGTSRFTMYISLYAYTPRVDFEVKAFWNEEYRFAKIGFAPSFKAPYATYEIAYGAIQRYAHTLR